MFDSLAGRLDKVFDRIRGRGKLTPDNIRDSLREMRRVLLEADVNYKVARSFIKKVEERAMGVEVLKSLTPDQQFIKIVHDTLVDLLGGQAAQLADNDEIPTRILFVGLQGSGKTTCVAKIAKKLRQRKRVPFLGACDVHRPAAVDQLQSLGKRIGCSVYAEPGKTDAAAIAESGWKEARQAGADYYLIDTAGRMQVDEEMMQEVERVRDRTEPHQILLVVDGLTGQEAVSVSQAFHERLGLGGVILTKMDGDARGGAALSVREVTGVPILFLGTGEDVDALETFHPQGMASRILGMGDVLSLVEKAQNVVSLEEAEKMRKSFEKNEFTFEQFLQQMKQMRKMGPLQDLVKLIPGLGAKALGDVKVDEKGVARLEAIVLSMTPEERRKPEIINGSRRRRIARGSGTTVQAVNRLLKDFQMMRKLFGKLRKGKKMPGLFQM